MSGLQRGMGEWGFLRLMSHDMQRAFYASDLPPTARFVSVTLAWHHNGKTGQCDPSIALLCEETGLSERAVRLSLRTIEAAGYMTTTPRRGTTPLYILTPPAPDAPRQQMPPGTTCPPPLPLDAPPPRHQMPLPPARRAPKLEGTGIRTGNEPESFASAAANAGNTDSLFPIEPPPPKPNREPKPKPETAADPRHREITSGIGAVFEEVMGEPFMFSTRFAKELSGFLKGFKGTSEYFLEMYRQMLKAGRTQFAQATKKAADPVFFCRNWNACILEHANIASHLTR